jgi:hypothetical protein
MIRLASALGLLGSLALLGEPAAVAQGTGLSQARERAADACLQAWKETPYRAYGYDHIVAIADHCSKPANCLITSSHGTTNTLLVGAGQTERALVFRGSPARDFDAKVSCTLGR